MFVLCIVNSTEESPALTTNGWRTGDTWSTFPIFESEDPALEGPVIHALDVGAGTCSDVIGILTDSPRKIICFSLRYGRDGSNGFNIGNTERPPVSPTLERFIDKRLEICVATVNFGHIEIGCTFPRLFAWFLFSEVGYGIEVVESVSCEANVHFDLPVMVEFGVEISKDLEGLVDLEDGSMDLLAVLEVAGGAALVLIIWNLRIPAFQKIIIKQNGHTLQLGWHKFLEDGIITRLAFEDLLLLVSYVHEEHYCIFRAGPKRCLADEGAQMVQVFRMIFVAIVSTQHNNGTASLASMSFRLVIFRQSELAPHCALPVLLIRLQGKPPFVGDVL